MVIMTAGIPTTVRTMGTGMLITLTRQMTMKHPRERSTTSPAKAQTRKVKRLVYPLLAVLLCSFVAQAQFNKENTGALTAGATTNYRYADLNEFPITVTVLGAVQRPGRYEVSRKIDIVNLLALAGGWRDNADMSDVRISREKVPSEPGGRAELRLDLENLTQVSPKFLQLQEGDCVLRRYDDTDDASAGALHHQLSSDYGNRGCIFYESVIPENSVRILNSELRTLNGSPDRLVGMGDGRDGCCGGMRCMFATGREGG